MENSNGLSLFSNKAILTIGNGFYQFLLNESPLQFPLLLLSLLIE
jgi:hypothetical protein